jgi:hypothetical protein
MANVLTSEVDEKLIPLNVGQKILYADKDKQLEMRQLCKRHKYERGGRLKVEIHFPPPPMETTHVALRQMKFYTVKDHVYIYKFYFKRYFVCDTFKYGDGAKF